MLYATATEVTLRVTTSCRMDVYLDDKLKCLKIIMYAIIVHWTIFITMVITI